MQIDAWEYFAPHVIRNDKAYVVFSTTKTIANPRGRGYVYNYVKVRIDEDDKVEVLTRFVDMKTLEDTMDQTFYSTIHDGETGAVHLFDGR